MSGESDNDVEEEVPTEMEVTYEHADSYRLVPVTSARGSYQPSNTLKFEFYNEYYPTPSQDIYEIDEEGNQEVIDRKQYTDIVRDIQFGIQLNQQNTLSIGSFMIATALGVPHQQVIDLITSEFEEELEGE